MQGARRVTTDEQDVSMLFFSEAATFGMDQIASPAGEGILTCPPVTAALTNPTVFSHPDTPAQVRWLALHRLP